MEEFGFKKKRKKEKGREIPYLHAINNSLYYILCVVVVVIQI